MASAKSSGSTIIRVPENREIGNSQTMDLLEGYLNTNPTSIGGPIIAIVDGTALTSEGEDSSIFMDNGVSNGQISTYIVRVGDTISSVAKMFDVSPNTVIWANDLKSKTLKVGQELVILPISGVRHIVKSGDTVASIAKKYNADQGDILSYNGLSTTDKLAVGDEIIIPDGVMAFPSGKPSSAATKIASGLKEFVGYYLRPLVGGRKSQNLHGHNGVDLAPNCRCSGDPIMASADGVVTISRASGYNGGYGIYVVLSHPNGTQTVYGHMSINYVSVGQRVSQGDMIGRVGNTGRSTGPHLHFEIRGARNPF